jgi:hypothetical protein
MTGLNGGNNGFMIQYDLNVGDVVVSQLMRLTIYMESVEQMDHSMLHCLFITKHFRGTVGMLHSTS